jgi:hypothetical protein
VAPSTTLMAQLSFVPSHQLARYKMEETTAQELASKQAGERKRPLSDLDNNNIHISKPLPVVSNSSNNSSPKKRMTSNDDDDDVMVLSPPPASRPGSSDGSKPANESNKNIDGDEDCVMEWSNASNVLVEYAHGRPDCGVHSFAEAANRKNYCEKCYCVVCEELAKDCKQWEEHCQQTKQLAVDSEAGDSDNEDEDSNVIDVEDDYDALNPAIHPAVLSYHGRSRAMAHMAANGWDGLRPTDGNYDHHYTKEFNEAYNDAAGRKERGRNPKDMRITEVLAQKLQEALELSEGTPASSYAEISWDDPDGGYAPKRERLKKRFETSKMEGDIPQLGLHKSFFVEGVRIGWPYPSILLPQRQMAIHLIKGLKNSRHVVLESPTGTGKSAAILCAVLAWQRHHAKSLWGKKGGKNTGVDQKQEKFPRIIYCSRTHSQVAQMVES